MQFEITPFKSVGVLEFGMDRAQVRSLLKGGMHEMPNKATYPEHLPECYEDYSIHVFYDERGRAEAFEFCGGEVPLYFEGFDLFSLHMEDAINLLKRGDQNPNNSDPAGLCFLSHGIGVFIPIGDKIEAILVARQGYFESFLE